MCFADRRVYDEWCGLDASEIVADMMRGFGPVLGGSASTPWFQKFRIFEPIWHMYLHYPSNPGGPFDD